MGGGDGADIAVVLHQLGVFDAVACARLALGIQADEALHILAVIQHVGGLAVLLDLLDRYGLVFLNDRGARDGGLGRGGTGEGPLFGIGGIEVILPDDLAVLNDRQAVVGGHLVEGGADAQGPLCLPGGDGGGVDLLAVDVGGDGISLDIQPHGGLGAVPHGDGGGLDLTPAGVVDAEGAVADLPHTGAGLTRGHPEHEAADGLVDGHGQLDGVVPAEGIIGGDGAEVIGDGHLAVHRLQPRLDGGGGPGAVLPVLGGIPRRQPAGVDVLALGDIGAGDLGVGGRLPALPRGNGLDRAVLVVDAEHTVQGAAAHGLVARVGTHGVLALAEHGGDIEGIVVGHLIGHRLFGVPDEVPYLGSVEPHLDDARGGHIATGSLDIGQGLIQRKGGAEQAIGTQPLALQPVGGGLKDKVLAEGGFLPRLISHLNTGGIDRLGPEVGDEDTHLGITFHPAAVPGGLSLLVRHHDMVGGLIHPAVIGGDAPAQADVIPIQAHIVMGGGLEELYRDPFILLGGGGNTHGGGGRKQKNAQKKTAKASAKGARSVHGYSFRSQGGRCEQARPNRGGDIPYE